MPGKRRSPGGAEGVAPRDPRDMAKAGLLEAQSSAMKVRIHRNDACNRCHAVHRHEPVRPAQPPRRGAPSSEGGQGDEWAACAALDTYDEDAPRDRLRGASPMATECP